MAEGWALVVGVTALFSVITLAALVLRARRGAGEAADGLLALGPTLVVLGIVFGADPLVGYSMMLAGVVLSVVIAVSRRSAGTA